MVYHMGSTLCMLCILPHRQGKATQLLHVQWWVLTRLCVPAAAWSHVSIGDGTQ